MAGSSNFVTVFSDDKIKEKPSAAEGVCGNSVENIVFKYEPEYAEAINESFFCEREDKASCTKFESQDEILEMLKEEELEKIKDEEINIPMDISGRDTPIVAVRKENGKGSEGIPIESRHNGSQDNLFANNGIDLLSESINRDKNSIDTQKHKCSECEFSSNKIFLLKKHLREHSNGPKHCCPHCSYATDHRKALERHQNSHKKGAYIFSCTWCDFKSTSAATTLHQYKCKARLMELSERLKENPSENMCDEPIVLRQHPNQYQKSSSNALKSNIDTGHEEVTLLLRKQIGKHLTQIQEYKKLNCPHCSYVTTYAQNMKRHEKSHKRSRMFSCAACEFRSTLAATTLHQFKCRAYLLKLIEDQKKIKSTAKSSSINDIQCSAKNCTSKRLEESENALNSEVGKEIVALN